MARGVKLGKSRSLNRKDRKEIATNGQNMEDIVDSEEHFWHSQQLFSDTSPVKLPLGLL
jgi:hypothetical protein